MLQNVELFGDLGKEMLKRNRGNFSEKRETRDILWKVSPLFLSYICFYFVATPLVLIVIGAPRHNTKL